MVFKGYRKFIITILVMLVATILLQAGTLDQETFKWLMMSSGVGYLGFNSLSKFGQ